MRAFVVSGARSVILRAVLRAVSAWLGAMCLEPPRIAGRCNGVECLLGQLALVGGMQTEELAASMGHATDLGHPPLEAGLVSGKVVVPRMATSVTEEGASMLAGIAGIDRAFCSVKGLGA